MLQFILMLLGLAFSNNNANTAACHNNQDQVTIQSGGPSNPGSGVDPGDTSGETTQTPPKK